LDIVDPNIDEYLAGTLAARDPILREMGAYGLERDFPIVGPQVGRLLYIITKSIHAMRILELGSGFGYSAMWFALALGDGGRVFMTEGSAENSARAREYFGRAGIADRASFGVGNALLLVNGIEGPFDIVFCDIDKHQYPEALPIARQKLRVGGFFICDNMLRGGKVLSTDLADDANTRGVLELTRQLMEAKDFYTTILPVRDGVSLSLRIA
jgi:predicted O-methyltransferase YrrM